MSVLGVVLAGGRGARIGADVPKALVPLRGRTLLDRALDHARAACDEVVVSAPAGLDLGAHGTPVVPDPDGAAGPLAGMVAAFASRRFESAIVLGVDFPLATGATLRALLERLARARAAGRHLTVPKPGGVPQPLVAAYAAESVPALAAAFAAGGRSPVAAVRAMDVEWIPDAELALLPGGLEAFTNVNTKEDLARAAMLLGSRAEREAS